MASEHVATLKLLTDKKENRVIFAEAGKDFVDFLFHILCAPLGTVAKLISEELMVGSLGKLYASVQSLNTTFLHPHFQKVHILDPEIDIVSKYSTNKVTFLNSKVSEKKNIIYPNGYVKEELPFMVKDDLEVTLMSGIVSVALLKEFNLKNLEDLEERIVYMSRHEGLMMLKASMQSKTVLTDVFLLGKPQVPNEADDEEDEDSWDDDEETTEDEEDEETDGDADGDDNEEPTED